MMLFSVLFACDSEPAVVNPEPIVRETTVKPQPKPNRPPPNGKPPPQQGKQTSFHATVNYAWQGESETATRKLNGKRAKEQGKVAHKDPK